MQRITLTLTEDERKALVGLAQAEHRHPRQQAAWLIRRELERRGLLQEDRQPTLQAAGQREQTTNGSN